MSAPLASVDPVAWLHAYADKRWPTGGPRYSKWPYSNTRVHECADALAAALAAEREAKAQPEGT